MAVRAVNTNIHLAYLLSCDGRVIGGIKVGEPGKAGRSDTIRQTDPACDAIIVSHPHRYVDRTAEVCLEGSSSPKYVGRCEMALVKVVISGVVVDEVHTI